MKNEPEAFYLNIDTQERVRVTWRVSLTVPAYMGGYVDVEATTPEEAAELAIDKPFSDVNWDYDFDLNYCGADVWDVECQNPPVDAMLVRPGYKSVGNLNAIFEPDIEAPGENVSDGGVPCE